MSFEPMHDDPTLAEPAGVAAIRAGTNAAGFAMGSEPEVGPLLRTLAAAKPGGRFLELGSGTGLATAWLLDGMDADSARITVDNDPAVLAILRGHLGHDPRLAVACADGDAFLASLAGRQFDLVFADTWAGKYRGLDAALALVRPGGFYVIDDMIPQPNWPAGHAERVAGLVAALEARRDLRLAKLAWASGVVIATKI